jgi:glycosyltransferase involved in cell wall biosynthesis
MGVEENHMVTEAVTPVDLPGAATTRDVVEFSNLRGKRVGMVVFSCYPYDPRPRRIIGAMLDAGMTIDLICEGDEKAPQQETLGGLKITRVPISHWRGGKLSYAYQYAAFILYSAYILAKRTFKQRYDLVYIHNMPDVLVMSALFPKMLGAKVILDQHDPMPELMRTIYNLNEHSMSVRIICWLEKWSLARANLVLTVNKACERLFSQRGCPVEKIGVVMNSPDEKIFSYREVAPYSRRSTSADPAKPFVVMYHGSLVERNGLDLAVEALARVREAIPNVELRVFGRSTPYLEQVLQRAKDLGIESRVRYLGAKQLEDLVPEIEACDVGVIPNQRNAFTDINTPTRIFEYLASGKPVIAPRTPGILDYFDSQSLFFFEAGDIGELATRIVDVYSDSRRAFEVAERGQRMYVAHTWQQEKQTLLKLVSGLLR